MAAAALVALARHRVREVCSMLLLTGGALAMGHEGGSGELERRA